MKVLFVSFHNPNSLGVHKKVMQQIAFFEISGNEVQAILINENYQSTSKVRGIQYVKPSIEPILHPIYKRRFIREYSEYVYQHKLNSIRYNYLQEYVSKLDFDFLYFRYPFCTLPLLKFVKNNKNKVVFEHNTVELNEIKGSLIKHPELHYYYLCEKYKAKGVFNKALCGVAVTEEIAKAENVKAGFNYADFIYINPIKVSDFRPRNYVRKEKFNIAILIGSYDEWHGLDLFCDAIRKEGKIDKYVFTYIGKVTDRVEEIFKQFKVNFTGPLEAMAIREKLEECDITVGSLATFRFDVNELSSLKTREYIAMGVPFIIGCKDTAIHNAPESLMEYIKVIDFQNEKNVLKVIEDFILRVKKDDSHPKKMHKFAKNKLDFLPVYSNLMNFIQTKL